METFKAEILDRGPLTPREAEVLKLVCEAMSDKEIARSLDISIKTVERHISHIYEKLGVQHARLHRRLLVLRVALTRGFVGLLSVCLLAAALDDTPDWARVGRCRLPRVQTARIRRVS